MADTASFPYEIHPKAYLGPIQEEAIDKLLMEIGRDGWDDQKTIKLSEGRIVDGRHRQLVALRLKELFSAEYPEGWFPAVEDLGKLTDDEAANFVLESAGLMMARTISPQQRRIYIVENFPSASPARMCELAGIDPKIANNRTRFKNLIACYKRSKRITKGPNPWEQFREGKLSQYKLLDRFGFESDNGSKNNEKKIRRLESELSVTSEASAQLGDSVETLSSEVDHLLAENQTLQAVNTDQAEYVKGLEKRLKSLDPQERIVRAAEGDATDEDRLRDRLSLAEDEVKKMVKINEKLHERVRSVDRIEYVAREVLSGFNWNDRAIAPPVLSQVGKQTRPHQFVALMSDAHYGEVVRPEEALGISYNCDIAKRRIEHYRDMLIRFKDLRAPSYSVEKITVAILGDMLSGNIHDELRATNERNITTQMSEMSTIIYDMLVDLAGHFPDVEAVVIPGNHPRVHIKPQNKEKYDNFEHAMGLTVKGAIEINPNVTNVKVTVPQDLIYIHDVYDYRIGMYHGDGAKSSSYGGIPFYGLMKKKDKIQGLFSERGVDRLDMIVMGHFHQHIYMDGECGMLINGAIKGADEYSINNFHSATAPRQVLLEFHPEHGLAAQEHINLEQIT